MKKTSKSCGSQVYATNVRISSITIYELPSVVVKILCKMDEILKILIKCMNKSATATIYSVPNFSLEVCVAMFVCGLYLLLHMEVTDIALHTISLRPNNVVKRSSSSKNSGSSISCVQQKFYKIRPTKSDLKLRNAVSSTSRWLLLNNSGDAPRVSLSDSPSLELHQKIDRVIGLSPEDYVSRCKNRRPPHTKYSLKSLTALYNDTVDSNTSVQSVKKHIDIAKEHLQLARISSDTARYFGRNSEAMTQSLFDLLEKLILSSSVQNPLPFKGDIPTLAFDAGNLKLKESHSSNLSFESLFTCEN